MTDAMVTPDEIHKMACLYDAYGVSAGVASMREVQDLAAEVIRLRYLAEVKYELLAAERGYDVMGDLRPRIDKLYMALNAQARGDENDFDGDPAKPWNRLVELSLTALVHWLANARWAVLEHREAERLRAVVGEPSRDQPKVEIDPPLPGWLTPTDSAPPPDAPLQPGVPTMNLLETDKSG